MIKRLVNHLLYSLNISRTDKKNLCDDILPVFLILEEKHYFDPYFRLGLVKLRLECLTQFQKLGGRRGKGASVGRKLK